MTQALKMFLAGNCLFCYLNSSLWSSVDGLTVIKREVLLGPVEAQTLLVLRVLK